MSEETAETKRKLKIILEELEVGNIITASWLIKKLAISLDRKGFAKPLKQLLQENGGCD
jgi:hypothetical protein